tara:strand:- start:133 stop:402 length:270 start_codon:yes stop_codon:yes gene_type:complete
MATKKTKEVKGKTAEELEQERKWDAERRQEEQERKIKKWIKIFVGLLFCVGGIWLAVRFWPHFITIVKEWAGPGVFFIGLIIILLGMLD